jgi:DNA topoisomerase IB
MNLQLLVRDIAPEELFEPRAAAGLAGLIYMSDESPGITRRKSGTGFHPRWSEVRDSTKYEHMLEFAKALPAVRARVRSDMAKRGLPREKVLAR